MRRSDPGYFLIGDGRVELERLLDSDVPLALRLRRAYVRFPAIGYLTSVSVMTLVIVVGTALFDRGRDAHGVGLWLVAALAIVPVSDLAVAVVNRTVTRVLGPVHFARLDLTSGIPSDLRTLVVVPTLLEDLDSVDDLVSGLEVHFLSNRHGDIRFALLTDWLDADCEVTADDDELLAAAITRVEALNERHGDAPGGGARFLVLHRRRQWNPSEGVWMGWERKRGKLEELNALLRGSAETSFVPAAHRPSRTAPPDVRYVITLDSDTRVPMGAASALVATIAHPLNRPVYDDATGRVTSGYGVLQPRITPNLPTEHGGSRFQQVFGGAAGIDPYSSAVSDVYQDLFQEGSFTGKGIYDVDAFTAALRDRVPDNTLLSHDLFEGVYARAGLVTDIELFDDFPSSYLTSAARQHRWARGDWQLLPWVVGSAPDTERPRHERHIGAVSRWKMVDNLRRSLSAPSMFAMLAAAWTVRSVSPVVWTLLAIVITVLPTATSVVVALVPRRRGISKRMHARRAGDDVAQALTGVVFGWVVLAHQAWLMADAIIRTLFRMFVSRRHMLEWTTSAQSAAQNDLRLALFARTMARSTVLVAVTIALVAVLRPSNLDMAAPFFVLWLAAPWVARRISAPADEQLPDDLDPGDADELRLIARRTWSFFETFVGPEDNWLPPDNVQEDPQLAIAHRTSPTNIGLYLLSIVTARDFGWIGTVEMVERLEATMTTLERLERFRGHLYNWYDTQAPRRIDPDYISTVDSGNLAGHLLTVAEACRGVVDQPIPAESALAGICDAIALGRLATSVPEQLRAAESVPMQHLRDALDMPISTQTVPESTSAWATLLDELRGFTATLCDIAATTTPSESTDAARAELNLWTQAARNAVHSHLRDLHALHAQYERGDVGGRFLTLAELAEHPDNFGTDGGSPAVDVLLRLRSLAGRAEALFQEMEFGFLFDPVRKLFSIGYRVGAGELDESYYDLLASECRLASFLAVAKGEVAIEHWFHLGRSLTPVGRGVALVSWSGSMFEYMMPSLVMREPTGSLLADTNRQVVRRQIAYGEERHIPWGISESGYNARDVGQAYQYSSFGVPGLGLKRGLRDDLVIAPYATGLASMVDAASAVVNFARLTAAGARGRYGFHEAIDFTPRRLPKGASAAIVKSYMSHHQGMLLVALGNVTNDFKMVDRFHSSSVVEAAELLLHERPPHNVLVARPRSEEVKTDSHVRDLVPPMLRQFSSPHDVTPRTHLLSNGRYGVMVTAAGSGYSRVGEVAVTRWREDPTTDGWGSFIYVRDVKSGAVRSVGHHPTAVEADTYEVTYSEDRAEFVRRDGSIVTRMTLVVSTEHDAEIRRISLSNLGTQDREIELTSYSEVVLAPQNADVAHPAFQNLFVQTEFVETSCALLATRRPRAHGEHQRWVAHVAAVESTATAPLQYETDRARFIGRGRTLRSPAAMVDARPLSNTVGPVLDPILSLRVRVHVPAGSTVHTIFSTVVSDSRTEVVDLADKFRDSASFERAGILAWTQAQVQLHHLGIDSDEAHLFQRLANRIIFSDPSLRPISAALEANRSPVNGLWMYGISGDLPILVVRVDQGDDLETVRRLLRAHEYWRMKLLWVDLVIVNEESASYAEGLQGSLEALVRTTQAMHGSDVGEDRGGVHVLRGDQLTPDGRTLLVAAARVVIVSRRGSLVEQVERLERPDAKPSPVKPRSSAPMSAYEEPPSVAELEFFNGLGGFASDGREYVTVLGPEQSTPAPWLNVIANPHFGFQVSESGSGYTWSQNSREHQLTPWSNDPVCDPPGEVLYVRDDDTGELWGPTALPIRCEGSTYECRHGAGYSEFKHMHAGINLELVQYVPLDLSLKASVLTIENRSSRTRRLSVATYTNWVLGSNREANAPWIVTALDLETGALTARNGRNAEFADRMAFVDLGGRQQAWTSDRTEFLGRNRSVDAPAGLDIGHRLEASAGAALDPCGVLQTSVVLAPGEHTELVATIGDADSPDGVSDLVRKARALDHGQELARVERFWNDTLRAIQVRTPDRSIDIMLNGWLTYQTLACRLWARAAFYQAGGAYGFRDQLQDVLALIVSRRDLAQEHILRAAGQQFPEGDVQHWWHPPSGRGVRTRISDDRLWLPYAVERFVEVTGDSSILDVVVPFIEGPALGPEQVDAYFEPEQSETSTSVYEHCVAAIERSLELGEHGLPLIGAGDWNDGMDRVGHEGRGESIWLGWFLYTVLDHFIPLALARGDARAEGWAARLAPLAAALERDGWDGDWYRRAYFDDGTPLGSATNSECRIDSIAQSWAVISGADDGERARSAMAAVDNHLVSLGDGIVRLFTPPFDNTDHDPGYIKGYLPGIRENGGQYTHGAVWSVIAFAALGDGDRAGDLFSVLNPINHTSTRAGVHRYKVEPYVIAADVYGQTPHLGRGGWTWYTGSAGWMYRAGIESILGFRLRGTVLEIDPCIPRHWPDFRIVFLYHTARYQIVVENPEHVNGGVHSVTLDGRAVEHDGGIALVDDAETHHIQVLLGRPSGG
ncbi:MAG: glucoamylase family protein [Ilumatobacteraceae bacterium]